MSDENRPPDQWTRDDYRALPTESASKLRRAWRAIDPRAATPNGAPYPLRSWPPDAAIDIQHLAEWTDTVVLKGRTARIGFPSSSLAAGLGRVTLTPTNTTLTGGFTINAATAVIPAAGIYRITGFISFNTSSALCQALAGSEAAAVPWGNPGGRGSFAAPLNSTTVSTFSTLQSLTTGQRVGLWYNAATIAGMEVAELTVEWAGAA